MLKAIKNCGISGFVGTAIVMVFWWIIAVGFANYGICWRTVLAFALMAGYHFVDTVIAVNMLTKEKKESEEKGETP
jgi:hypothetical protein